VPTHPHPTGRSSSHHEDASETAGSAVDRVVHFLRDAIRAGQFVPGQRLVEPDLIEMLEVGRSSLREALRRLEAEGVVEIQQFRGARVRQMSREDVLELNEIRAVLEGYAAASAAQRLDKAGRRALVDLEREIDRGRSPMAQTYSDYNAHFHDLILRLGGHVHLPHFIAQTRLAVFRLQFDMFLLTPSRMKHSRAEHRAIVKAILKGDAIAAEAAMRRHIGNTSAEILKAPISYFSG
jgi:DNA-binding GntR family transcriptional regulator